MSKGKGTMIKDFRAKVLEKRKDISDKDILLSEQCHAYFKNLVEAVTKMFNQTIQLCIVWTDDDWVAFATDRYEVQLNMNNAFVLGAEDRVDKVVLAKGITIHECGHLLFTDYHLLQSVKTVMTENRKLFPEPKCDTYAEWLADAAVMNDSKLTQWLMVWKRLENSIEDGFIEYKLLDLLPGEGQCLYALRKVQLTDFESVKTMKAKGYSNPIILFNCILMLAKYNTILMDADDASEPAIATLLDNYDLIRQAVYTEKSYDRIKLINEIFCNLYHFMKEDAKKDNEPDTQDKSSGDSGDSKDQKGDSGNSGESNDTGEENSSCSEGADERDEQDDNEQSGDDRDSAEREHSSFNPGKPDDDVNSEDSSGLDQSDASNDHSTGSGDAFDNEPADSNNPDETSGNQKEAPQNNQKQSKDCSPSDLLENSPEEMNEQVDTGSGSVLNDNNINQKPMPPAQSNEDKLKDIMEGTKPDETAQVPSPQDKLFVDHTENNLAEKAVMDNAENDLAEELKQEVEAFDFTAINKNFPITIIRKEPSKEAYALYEKAMDEIGFLVKKTVNELRNKIKDQQQGGKLNGMYNGRYLDRNNLHRFDLRVMCKNDLPEDIPDMAVSILIDGSSSMRQNNKDWHAVLTALTIYLVCKELDVPVMVYSHHASRRHVEITALSDFYSVDGKDKYRICDLKTAHGNRDGMALRFCSEKLANRPEQNKFQMIISDGLPSVYSSTEEGLTDIRNVLMDYSKKNVKYIAYGLGEEQKRIEEIYVQDLSSKTAAKFIKTNAPEELPKMFVKSIKDLIKV